MATNISLMNIYHANGTNFDLNLISSLLLPEHDPKIQKSQKGLVRGLTPGRAWMESNFHFSRIAIFTLGACLNTISKPLGSNFAILTPEGHQAPLRWLGYTI